MQTLAIPGVSMWSVWQPDRKVFFNSYFVVRPEGNVVVDPLALSEDDAREIEAAGGVALAIVTNRDHERRSSDVIQRFGAKLAASVDDAPLLQSRVDKTLREGDEPFAGARVIAFEGMKSPGEIALHLRAHDAAIVGDALWGEPAG